MITPQVLRKLTREVVKLQKSPPDGIAIEIKEQDILNLDGWIQGPIGTPYENGYFRINFQFLGTDYPIGPPKCTMLTKIFHPNIHSNGGGEICVSTLKKDWNPSFGIEHILTVIKCLLISPNPDSALDAEAAKMLQEAYDEYSSTASMWTRIHASNKPACMISQQQQRTTITSEPSTSSTKKIDVESIDGFSNWAGMENALSIAAQPLARSESRNLNLHQKSSFEQQQQQRRQISSNNIITANGISTLQQQQQNQKDEIAFSDNDINSAAMIIQSGAAAAAAAATTAAMTAAMTAGMCKVSLQESNFCGKESLKLSQTRKRIPVVRRGIKRL